MILLIDLCSLKICKPIGIPVGIPRTAITGSRCPDIRSGNGGDWRLNGGPGTVAVRRESDA